MVDLLGDDGLLDLRNRKRDTNPATAVADIRASQQDAPATNADLEEWAAKQTPGEASHECHLCGAAPRLRCGACQQMACGKDSWVMLGLCRTCATEQRMKMWHDRNRTVSDNWL